MHKQRIRKRATYGSRPPKVTPKGKQFRVQVFDPASGAYVSACSVLAMKAQLFGSRSQANAIAREADAILATRRVGGEQTIRELSERWIAFKRTNVDGKGWEKESSALVNIARVRPFVDAYGDVAVDQIEEEHWAALGGPLCNLAAVKAMLAWAATAGGGRLIDRNPFADLRSSKSKGNRLKNPPSEIEIARMIGLGYELMPSFGAWLEFACDTGMRPGEIDGLRWCDVIDGIDEGMPYIRILIRQQFSATSATFTLPKSNVARELEIDTDSAAAHALRRAKEISDGRPFVFVNTQGGHFTGHSRRHYWDTVYDRMGWAPEQFTPYLATRHYAGWFMVNQLDLESEDVAFRLGHNDGGELVRKLYGHRDKARAQRRVRQAYREQLGRKIGAAA